MLYVFTAYPGVGPTDSGELALAAWTGGVAHPPGFPLYTALGWIWSHVLPWGSVAWRLNVFSAFAMAIAAGFVVAIARRWAMAIGAVSRIASFAGVIAGAAFAVGPIAWSAAVVTEVYALNALIVAAIVLVISAYAPTTRALAIAGALAGAGFAVHPVSTLFVVPMLIAWVWSGGAFLDRPTPCAAMRNPPPPAPPLLGGGGPLPLLRCWEGEKLVRKFRRALVLGACAAFVLLVSYAWLLMRAQQDPAINWGNPNTLERLWWHMSAAQYRVLFSLTWQRTFELFGGGLRWWGAEFAVAGTVLGVAGWWMLRRVSRAFAVGCVGVALATFAYTSAYDIAQDREFYFLPLLALTACGIAPALAMIAARARAWTPYAPNVVLAVGAIIAIAFVPLRWEQDRSRDTIASDYARNALATVPPNALVIIADWQLYAPAWYLQEVEGFRRDLVLVDLLLWENRPWYVDGIARRYSAIAAQWQPTLGEFRGELERFERGNLQDTTTIARAYRELLSRMLATTDRRVFLDGLAASEIIRRQPEIPGVPVPVGLLLEVHRGDASPAVLPSIAGWRLDALRVSRSRRDPVIVQIRDQYVAALQTRGRYLERFGDAEGAAAAAAVAASLIP